jgi:hypothetical protein
VGSPTFTDIALQFGEYLVAGEFERAHELLAPNLAASLTSQDLRSPLVAMYSYASGDQPVKASFDPQFAWEAWPQKQAGDLGGAYVSILGDEFVEAVTVIVAAVNGQPRIRQIEWGRP